MVVIVKVEFLSFHQAEGENNVIRPIWSTLVSTSPEQMKNIEHKIRN